MADITLLQLRNRAVMFACCLLVPVIYLWVSYLTTAFVDVKKIRSEQRGMELASLLNDEVFRAYKGGRTRLNEIASEFGVTVDIDLGKLPGEQKFQALKKLQSEIATKSGLILDGDQRTSYLVSAGFVRAPEALQHFAIATGLARTAVGPSHDENSAELTPVLLAAQLGTATSDLDGAAEDLVNSCDCKDAFTQDYQDIKLKLMPFRNRSSKMLSILTSNADHAQAFSDVSDLLTTAELSHSGTAYDSFFTIVAQKINESLAQRLNSMLLKIGIVSAVGLIISLFGVVISFTIYRHSSKATTDLHAALKKSEAERTQSQMMNDEIAGLNVNLASKVDELEQAQNELLRKSRFEQLGQLTATIAHEIRNPMGAIRTSAFIIGKKIGANDSTITAQVQRINIGVARCDKIISQLLDYSRTKKIDAAAGDLDTWISDMLNEEVEHVSPKVHFICDLGIGERMVSFDPTRMRRALMNLINNGVDAMLAAGETADKTQPQISIITRIENGFATITVKDNGPGIAPENMKKIFEPLFTTKGFGTGLGLPAVVQIAEQHGGKLEVSSTVGDGATFKMYLALDSSKVTLAA
ncbi:MAG: ATP-binding protein [Aestuariivirga sp.]